MLRTAAGRAYLAFCPATERDIILKQIERAGDPDDRPYLTQDYLERMVAETRTRGFASRTDGEYNPRTSSIAVAIIRDDRVLGCISIIWIRSALDAQEAVSQFAGPMMETAAQLGRAA